MKNLILITLICFFNLTLYSQVETVGCKDLKQDTLEGNFIIEVNCNNLYYSSETVIFQNNLMFFNSQHLSFIDPQFIYKKDSVFIYSWYSGIDYYKYKPCIDFSSLNNFLYKVSKLTDNKRNKSFYKKSTIKNKDGIEYLRFYGKLIVFNIGEFEWNIPGIYCGNSINKEKNGYCKRPFKNTLLLLKVLDFKYYCEYSK